MQIVLDQQNISGSFCIPNQCPFEECFLVFHYPCEAKGHFFLRFPSLFSIPINTVLSRFEHHDYDGTRGVNHGLDGWFAWLAHIARIDNLLIHKHLEFKSSKQKQPLEPSRLP